VLIFLDFGSFQIERTVTIFFSVSMTDLRVIQLLVKVGKCLALTPFSLTDSKPCRLEKIYKFGLLTLYTVVTICTWYTRMVYYAGISKIQLACKVLIDLNAYAHSCYTLVVVKKQQWFTLMHTLAKIDNPYSQEPHVLSALVPLVAFGVVTLSEMYYWYESFGLISLCFFFFEVLRSYCQFFYTIFTCIILRMILARYRYQNLLCRQKILLARFKHNFHELTSAIRIFNELFGWSILLDVSVIIPRIITLVHFLIRGSKIRFKFKSQNLFLVQNCELISVLVIF
jgi:hypothetical protein